MSPGNHYTIILYRRLEYMLSIHHEVYVCIRILSFSLPTLFTSIVGSIRDKLRWNRVTSYPDQLQRPTFKNTYLHRIFL
ncbi:hypothetical protein BCR42DRAFT_399369 [Absidia repens]|uniref:Uncharacterized protein n=1 Tax=Absidia repens TaxID=90262 RepID=A0A1X2IZX5_9FUNG|nr:hypothetical protein BCR42DRAFT_399369 [Absidia repens]